MLFGGVAERDLLAQDRLATARHPDDQVDRVFEQAAVQDVVEALATARESFVHSSPTQLSFRAPRHFAVYKAWEGQLVALR